MSSPITKYIFVTTGELLGNPAARFLSGLHDVVLTAGVSTTVSFIIPIIPPTPASSLREADIVYDTLSLQVVGQSLDTIVRTLDTSTRTDSTTTTKTEEQILFLVSFTLIGREVGSTELHFTL